MSAINEVIAALAKAQGGYKKLVANEWVPGGSYANLQAILDATRESLSANGLAFYQYIQPIDEGTGGVYLKSILAHSSGQFLESTGRLVTPETDKAIGNSYEIHKRFHALMLLGIAPSDKDPYAYDDDGHEAGEDHLVRKLRRPEKVVDYNPNLTLTVDRARDLEIELTGHKDLCRDILKQYGVQELKDLPDAKYIEISEMIRRVKRTLENYEAKKRLEKG